eukprot:9313380-Pyramimonas_sp.AAC.1
MGSPASSNYWRAAPEENTDENTPLLSLRPTQTQSSLRLPHLSDSVSHSDSLITQTHSPLRLTHHSDPLITRTQSRLRLIVHHPDSLIT